MAQRIASRHGLEGSHLIMRFRLYELMEPGADAEAEILLYSGAAGAFQPLPGAQNRITVQSTFYRSFGFTGEEGWATLYPDNENEDGPRWEVTSMEGSLLRPAIAAANIAPDGTGNVTIGGSYVVAARNFSMTSITLGDRVIVFFNPADQLWYVSGSAGSDRVWKGIVTATPTIAPGAAGNVLLSTGGTVLATNWSIDTTLDFGDKVFVWQDSFDDTFNCVKSGGSGGGVRLFDCALYADLSSDDANAQVTSIVAWDGGGIPAADPLTVPNLPHLSGEPGDYAIFGILRSGEDDLYRLVQVRHVIRELTTRMEWDEDAKKLIYWQQRVTVMHEDDENDPAIDVFAAEANAAVYNVTWDETGHFLKFSWYTLYTLPSTVPGGVVAIVAAEYLSMVESVTWDPETHELYYTERNVWTFPASDPGADVDIVGAEPSDVVGDVFYDESAHAIKYTYYTLWTLPEVDVVGTDVVVLSATQETVVENIAVAFEVFGEEITDTPAFLQQVRKNIWVFPPPDTNRTADDILEFIIFLYVDNVFLADKTLYKSVFTAITVDVPQFSSVDEIFTGIECDATPPGTENPPPGDGLAEQQAAVHQQQYSGSPQTYIPPPQFPQ